jgi:hypothetical protein
MRPFLQRWKLTGAKGSKPAGRPQKMEVHSPKTKKFYEKLSAELTHCVLRFFLAICLKYSACHKKVNTKCCTCHSKVSVANLKI